MDKKSFKTRCLRRGYGTAPMITAWIFANPKADYTEDDCEVLAAYCQTVDWMGYGKPGVNKELKDFYELDDKTD